MVTLPEKLPWVLALELSNKCNYKCPFCYCLWHEYPELARHVLSAWQWKKVIDEAIEKGCRNFLFTGGEPLLRKDLPELIEYAQKTPDTQVDIFTNGSRMTEELLQYFKARKVGISTSLQGLRTYSAMTGTRRKFYKTIDLIARCRELEYPCQVGITVTAINMFEVEDIVSAAAFAGAAIIQLSVFMNAGRGKDNSSLQINESQWRQIKAKVKALPCSSKVVFGEEFECKCLTDASFKCPAEKDFGVVSPNGVYRQCLHYYQPNAV